MSNLYADLNAFKARIRFADAEDDAALVRLLADASREIDNWTHHRFYVETRTRTFRAHDSGSLLLPDGDLLAVTTLKTDPNGDRTYPDTWETTDYDLGPEDALYESPPAPYWQIAGASLGDYSFPSGVARGVQIAGSWGYYQVLERSTATAAEILDATETGVDVSDGTQFSIGHTLLVDSEQMYVSAIATNTLTVTRGVNGTTAATHASGAAIDVYTYPLVGTACLMQAQRLWARRDSPLGITGSMEFGTMRISAALDPDVQKMLYPLKRRVAG